MDRSGGATAVPKLFESLCGRFDLAGLLGGQLAGSPHPNERVASATEPNSVAGLEAATFTQRLNVVRRQILGSPAKHARWLKATKRSLHGQRPFVVATALPGATVGDAAVFIPSFPSPQSFGL
jgi:hypothetical protein